jgi:NAD(P)-dependent dehydrogenase (short-subunit alcohol dehydrogenase family)|tara:strand:+ start:1319 stop:2137 length:819 start_codon:yes stop_codon:yes gene_type:complete
MNKVTGKFAFITGGTQGLGAAIAREFAKNECAGIVTIGRKEKEGKDVASKIIADTGCPVHFIKTDLSSVEDIRNAMAFMKEKFGRIDILVNAAGMTDRGTIVDTSEELFDKMIGTNLKGPFFLIQEAAKIMIEQNIEGSMINIGSVSAMTGQPFISAYCVSKGALATLTRNTAFALLKNKIRVNQLNIGWMGSDGEHEIQTKYHGAEENWLDKAGSEQPFKRLLSPEEVSKAVSFLASNDSGMMTGSVVNFDQSVWGGYPFSPPVPAEKMKV